MDDCPKCEGYRENAKVVIEQKDEEIARLRECVAGAHALRCICGDVVNAVADIRDPRCRETQAMALHPGGAPSS